MHTLAAGTPALSTLREFVEDKAAIEFKSVMLPSPEGENGVGAADASKALGTGGLAGGPKFIALSPGGEIPWPLYFAIAEDAPAASSHGAITFIGKPDVLSESKEFPELMRRVSSTPSFQSGNSTVGYVTPDTDLDDFPPHLRPLIRSLKEMGKRLPGQGD